jgi:hypothetical protein
MTTGMARGLTLAELSNERFEGRHPAALNFGDCCTYAVASVWGEPLLCIEDDFARTDLLLVSLDPHELSAASEQPHKLGRRPIGLSRDLG